MKKRIFALLLALALVLGLLPLTALAADFTDVPDGKFYSDAVDWAVENEITNGYPGGLFKPETDCTRGHAVTFLWRAADEPAHSGNNPFTDVQKGKFYYDAVLWAVENGITSGMTATTFAPEASCTRGHVVTFLWRAADQPEPAGENPFPDVEPGKFYSDAVLWAVENEITNGYPGGLFKPLEVCNRGQIVTFLHRYFGETQPPVDPDVPETPGPLTITQQPADATAVLGDWVTFSVAATGGQAPYTYQWLVSNDGSVFYFLEDDEYCQGSATAQMKTIATLGDLNGTTFYCEVTDATGEVVFSEPAILTTQLVELTVTQQPRHVTRRDNKPFTLTVEVGGGTAPYTYQWHTSQWGPNDTIIYDNAAFTGATTASLRVDNDVLTQYWCVITDAAGNTVTTEKAQVAAPLTITKQPSSTIVKPGEAATFEIRIEGGVAPYTYLWYRNATGYDLPLEVGRSCTGSQTDTLNTLVEDASADGTQYWCVVTDSAGDLITSSIVYLYMDS